MAVDNINKVADSTYVEKKQQALEAIKPSNIKDEVTGSVGDITMYFEKAIINFVDWIPELIKATLGLIIGLFIIRTTLRLIKKYFEKRNVDLSLRGFLLSIIKFMLYAMLITVVASNLGFKTTAIIGALSGLVLAAGLALQGSLSNFAGGVLILLFRPFEVGDYIENNSGTEGTVEKIDLLYTTLTTVRGLKVFSPNGTLANSVIRNFTKATQRRIDVVVGIGYEDNIKTAKEVILNTISQDQRIKTTPEPLVFVSELADSSVNLTIQVWTERADYLPTLHDLQGEIKVALDNSGINIPYPQHELRIINK